VVLTYVAGGGDHATSFKLLWKIETVDADFIHEAVLNLQGQTVTVPNAAGKTVSFKARATNSTASTDSAVKQVVMP
jgi:saccharopine dehydrogenase-like NADP-dependent oxidoreductase